MSIAIAGYRAWPDRLDWDEGPDAPRYPDLYTPTKPDNQDELEPLNLHKPDSIN